MTQARDIARAGDLGDILAWPRLVMMVLVRRKDLRAGMAPRSWTQRYPRSALPQRTRCGLQKGQSRVPDRNRSIARKGRDRDQERGVLPEPVETRGQAGNGAASTGFLQSFHRSNGRIQLRLACVVGQRQLKRFIGRLPIRAAPSHNLHT